MALTGEAQLLLTAPAYISLGPGHDLRSIVDRVAPDAGITFVDDEWSHVFRGSLTFHDTTPTDMARFRVDGPVVEDVAAAACAHAGLEAATAEMHGLVFADGSLSLAVAVTIPAGWSTHRSNLLEAFGPERRDQFSGILRGLLSDWTGASGLLAEAPVDPGRFLPYFNLTYVGRVEGDAPGRAVVDGSQLRSLVYPRSTAPIRSGSPLVDEYLYAGYAFLLLGVREGSDTPRKLRDLLLILDVVYGQLACAADAVTGLLDDAPAPPSGDSDDGPEREERPSWQVLERDLRRRYRELVTPTFSYDHHVLSLRNSILDAWGVEELLVRTQELLRWGHERETKAQLDLQERRTQRMNRVLEIIGLLAVFQTAESIRSLAGRIF